MRISSKLRIAGVAAVLCAVLPLAQAHGPYGYRGFRGGYYGWGYYDPWVAPLVVGAAVGTAVYVSRPVLPSTVFITNPPVVVSNPGMVDNTTAAAQPGAEAYFCRESGLYFPNAQTCPSPWLVVYPR